MLRQLKAYQREKGKSLGALASELLAAALAQEMAEGHQEPLKWVARPMRARVDLEDPDAVERVAGMEYRS